MTIVLGFSGGVDSAVSAALLKKQGYAVHGLYLDNADERARRDAEETADFLGLPLTVLDVRAELEERVCAPFAASYRRGETPNPCVRCNPTVKFKNLITEAGRLGAEHIATGHYARAENGALYKGRPANDQSYMLSSLTREQLARCVFPLGGYEKREVRALAEELALPVAKKPDSMEICFIPDKDYVRWLAARAPLPGPGPFVFRGAVVGEHAGICRYTVGQRRPGLYEGRKLYIKRIDAASNTIELALWEELFETELLAADFNWLCDAPTGPIEATVRVRHTKWEEPPCTAYPLPDGGVRIVCETPVRAPAPGQAAVLYAGERVLGGGRIAP